MYGKGNAIKKALGILVSLLKRSVLVFKLHRYDYVFVHREMAPVGPPFLEFIVTKILRKKLIFDYDDAIWLTDEKARLTNFIRCFWKVRWICKSAYKVSCGNDYLASYARNWNTQVVLNPTTIDTDYHQSRLEVKNALPIIGWTGSHSTLKYLSPLIPLLKQFEDQFKLLVICNTDPAYDLKNYEFVAWSEETEIVALDTIDIGIMPLPNDEWTKGKCGFKALQYMALKKPVVISPVGVNTTIIQEGENGFLSATEKDWEIKLKALLNDSDLRTKIGEEGYKTVLNNYSVLANRQNFYALFE